MRKCSQCGEVCPPTSFSSRQSKCKACQREYHRKHYLANKERYTENARAWRALNPERRREIARNYARRNPEVSTKWARENPDGRRVVAREWARRNLEKVANHTRNRKSRQRDAFVEAIDIAIVRLRDGGTCGICGETVGPREQSIDHIIPLSRGGLHEYANVQLAHLSCNKRKNARPTS